MSVKRTGIGIWLAGSSGVDIRLWKADGQWKRD